MAQPITCDMCETERAVMLQTDIDTGAVLAVGAACLFPFFLGAARGIADGMLAPVKEQYADDVRGLAVLFTDWPEAIGSAETPAKRPRARRGKPVPGDFPAPGAGTPEHAQTALGDDTVAGDQ